MRPVICLEAIGDDYFWHKRYGGWTFMQELRYMRRLGPDKSPSWIARIILENGEPKRKYLTGVRDYEKANATGSRGIFCYYPLRDGLYEINDRYCWDSVKHYFAIVRDGEINETSREEAIQWLRQNTKNI